MVRCLILLILGIFSLTACGTDNETQPSAETESPTSKEVGSEFAARAAAVCEGALEAKRAWSRFPVAEFNPTDPDPVALPEVATWLQREVAPTFEAWLADLQALGEPPTGRDTWNDVLTAVDGIVRLNAAQVAAAMSAGIVDFARATKGLGDIQIDLVRATEVAGVPTCADVHG